MDGLPTAHVDAPFREGEGYGIPRRIRRYPRVDVSWPVVVEAGKRFVLLQAVDVSRDGLAFFFAADTQSGLTTGPAVWTSTPSSMR